MSQAAARARRRGDVSRVVTLAAATPKLTQVRNDVPPEKALGALRAKCAKYLHRATFDAVRETAAFGALVDAMAAAEGPRPMTSPTTALMLSDDGGGGGGFGFELGSGSGAADRWVADAAALLSPGGSASAAGSPYAASPNGHPRHATPFTSAEEDDALVDPSCVAAHACCSFVRLPSATRMSSAGQPVAVFFSLAQCN